MGLGQVVAGGLSARKYLDRSARERNGCKELSRTLALNCPYCELPLLVVRIEPLHLYRCGTHGLFEMDADGRLRSRPETTH